MSVPLDTPASRLVGDRTAEVLASGLQVHTVGDLLWHLPRRYAERGSLTDLADLRVGEQVTVLAEIASVTSRPMRQRRGSMLTVVVTDGTGELGLTFFNQKWREQQLRVGRRALFSGKVSAYRGGRQLSHPDYQFLDGTPDAGDADSVADYAGAVLPLYPATAALPSWRVAKAVALALDGADLTDPMPADVRERHGLVSLAEAMQRVHRPQSVDDPRRGRQRLVFDEALVLQLALAQRRADAATRPAVARRATPGGLVERFDAALPFALTAGQQAVAADLAADLAQPHPMHRLLQGEVGSGKTVLALRAMLTVVDAAGQAALLAPTEVLAAQHYRALRELLGPLAGAGTLGADEAAIDVLLLTGSASAASRRAVTDALASGTAGIVVGTHALLTESVTFADLGLVVVDEQHRFGVEQREALRLKGGNPHVLVMTATPIPRTVAMTVFGDLEVSTLTELPAGRQEIRTHVVDAETRPHHLARVWDRIREEVAEGRQAFVVAARIGGDPGGGADAADAADGAEDPDAFVVDDEDAEPTAVRPPALGVIELGERLATGELAGLRTAVLHGRMPSDAKDDVMRRFAAGDVDVLIATTVVEVGVDVPNASVMVVMDADRFGVSQLHQLRGRVGRGAHPGLCLLVTRSQSADARERLHAVAGTVDGFALARVDLQTRREGDVLGALQSGRRSSLRLLSVIRDEEVIRQARDEATALVAGDPDLSGHPALARAVADLAGDRADYLEKA